MLNKEANGGSAVLELVIGLVLVVAVGVGVYHVQHPEMTPQQQITASMQQ